jgi:hypothetical protein
LRQHQRERVPLQNAVTGLTWGVSAIRLRGAVVLVDHTAEHLAVLHWGGQERVPVPVVDGGNEPARDGFEGS